MDVIDMDDDDVEHTVDDHEEQDSEREDENDGEQSVSVGVGGNAENRPGSTFRTQTSETDTVQQHSSPNSASLPVENSQAISPQAATGMKRVGCTLGSKVAVTTPSDATLRRSNMDKLIAKLTEKEELAAEEDRKEKNALFSFLDNQQKLEMKRDEDREKRQTEMLALLCNFLGGIQKDRIVIGATSGDNANENHGTNQSRKRSIEVDDEEYKAYMAFKRSKK
jgi:hypothetical protein